ncbi:MAG: hypothetical protein AAB410_02470 [Patescibacteria group bacterium]
MNKTNPKLKIFVKSKSGIGAKKTKGFVGISNAIEGHPKSKILKQAFYKHRAINTWEKAVSEFFEGAEAQSKAVDFKEGVLMVACLSKDLAYKIKAFAQRIIYILNQLIGKDLVFAIRVEY